MYTADRYFMQSFALNYIVITKLNYYVQLFLFKKKKPSTHKLDYNKRKFIPKIRKGRKI